GHFQISLYFLTAVLMYIIYKFIIDRNIRKVSYTVIFTFLGVLLTMPQVLPSMELYLESFRSSFFQKGGIPIEYIPTLLAPDFFGNPVTRNTWFGHYAEWNAYIGVLPLMLAFYSFVSIKKPQVLFLFFFGIIAFSLGINSPISDFVLNLHLPVFSTSSLNRIIILYSFAFAVLAGFGYDRLLLDIKNANKKRIIFWVCFFIFIFIILWSMVVFKLFIPIDKISITKQNLILPTILFLASGAIVVCGAIFRKLPHVKVIQALIASGLITVVAFDMLRFAGKWQAFDPKNLVFPDFPTANALSKISGFNRVFGNLGGEATIYYKLPSVEGYDALYSKRYGEFIGYIEKEEIIESAWSVVSFPKHSKNTQKAINFLNIKYIVHKIADNGVSWTFPIWIYPQKQFSLFYKDGLYEFYQNNNVLPHAFLVGEYQVIKDKRKILETIFSDAFDVGKEIVLEENPKISKAKDVIGDAKIINYKQNSIDISVDAKSNALLFLTDNYYGGWKATVDGRRVPILRANYTFRAVPVRKGKHAVKFFYEPWSFSLGIYLAAGGLVGIVLLTLISKSKGRLKSISS
ncbi:MAG: YfhO family protein, partial [Candidatus Levybacteria bacterium]|nr:YfhO family protein [Candidatus Levybacteria bacterium]